MWIEIKKEYYISDLERKKIKLKNKDKDLYSVLDKVLENQSNLSDADFKEILSYLDKYNLNSEQKEKYLGDLLDLLKRKNIEVSSVVSELKNDRKREGSFLGWDNKQKNLEQLRNDFCDTFVKRLGTMIGISLTYYAEKDSDDGSLRELIRECRKGI